MKGIILAGGTGSRLWPITSATSKQLLPVYDKPMIFYPLSVLMLAGVREILIIGRPVDLPRFKELLGDGSTFGISLDYAVQEKPRGIAEALIIGEAFTSGGPVWLVLGDNIFFGNQLRALLTTEPAEGSALIFAYRVADPSDYAVVELDAQGSPKLLVEKPQSPLSHLAVPGLYRYPPGASEIVRYLTPSARGELEITDLNLRLLRSKSLEVRILPRGTVWLDAGTVDSLMDAGTFVQAIEKRQGFKVACLEEIALRNGWVSIEEVMSQAARFSGNSYGEYLQRVVELHEME